MRDNYQAQGLRKKLIEEIRLKGIRDEKVLEAMGKVPRHLFMDSSFLNHAYVDKAFPIGSGQTISQPYTVAFQTELLRVERGHKVLEIGTGSGYQAAILCEMGAKVYTLERIKELYSKVIVFLPSIGYHPRFFFADGFDGIPTYGPFDRIIVTAGATDIPEKLLPQLKIGGLMVIPVGDERIQNMILLERISEHEFKKTSHGQFSFVPLLGGLNN